MKLKSLSYVSSSDLFERISTLSEGRLTQSDVANLFGENCTEVSYGDASHTLISIKDFVILCRQIWEIEDDEDIWNFLDSLLQIENCHVDLEN